MLLLSAGLQALLDQTSEESLNLALEALKAAVNADLHPQGSENALSRQVLQLWAQHVADPLLSEGCKDIVEAWASSSDSLPDLLVGLNSCGHQKHHAGTVISQLQGW